MQGENDIDQLCCVLRVLGTPNESIWPVSMEVTYDYPNTLGPRSVRIINVPVCETTLFVYQAEWFPFNAQQNINEYHYFGV